jgi:GNAT acetyltransferase-like protein
MSFELRADSDPSQELREEVAGFAPVNPFYASAYLEARRASGYQPWVVTLRRDGKLVAACTAFMKSGYLGRSLEITSLPAFPDWEGSEVFWGGLLQVCRQHQISDLLAHTYGSPEVMIPALPGEIRRRLRCEYVLELQRLDLWDRLSPNHERNIKRGRKAGLQMRRVVEQYACQEHARLIGMSLERRKSRGESVPQDIQVQSFVAMVQSGAGELFQAVLDGVVLSSILVLTAARGAYYQSAGTSPQGMARGASHFLVYEIANTLREQRKELFNLGGADELNSGLARFKAGFGATLVKLEEAEFFLGNPVRQRLRSAVRLLRDHSLFVLGRSSSG